MYTKGFSGYLKCNFFNIINMFVKILGCLKRLFISTYLSLHDESYSEGNIGRVGSCCSNMFLYSCCHYVVVVYFPADILSFSRACQITHVWRCFPISSKSFQLATLSFLRFSNNQSFDFISVKVCWCDRCPFILFCCV